LNYHENRELWLQRVEGFKNSGLTQINWCEQQNIRVSALRYWLRKLKDEESSPGIQEWVQLEVPHKNTDSSDTSIKIHVGSVWIEVREGFSRTALLDVVQTLSTLC